jgi:hypothetical protein
MVLPCTGIAVLLQSIAPPGFNVSMFCNGLDMGNVLKSGGNAPPLDPLVSYAMQFPWSS